MCIHSSSRAKALIDKVRDLVTGKATKQNIQQIALRNRTTGRLVAAVFVDATDVTAIANAARDLRAWHPGNYSLDLEDVNFLRAWVRDLPTVGEFGLTAFATKPAVPESVDLESQDPETILAVSQQYGYLPAAV